MFDIFIYTSLLQPLFTVFFLLFTERGFSYHIIISKCSLLKIVFSQIEWPLIRPKNLFQNRLETVP